MERGKDRVRPALARAELVAVIDGEKPGVGYELDPVARERVAHRLVSPPCERAHVGARVDQSRADLGGEPRELRGRASPPDDQARAAVAELGVELAQALEKELGPRARGVAAAEQGRIEAERRHHSFVGVEGRPQGGMVA